MRHALLLAVLCATLLAAAPTASAHHWQPGACGLPVTQPLHVEFGEVSVSPLIRKEIFAAAKPSLVVATSQRWLADELRADGLHTIFWEMKLPTMVGLTTMPLDPQAVREAADRLVRRAAAETGCSTPLVALNELHGAWLPTPWSETNTGYRANALAFLARMHELGARPFLMVPTAPAPFTDSPEAAAWWRQVGQVSDVVLQVHFDGRYIDRHGATVGSRFRRTKMRRVLDQFTAAGVPAARLGLLHGFQSGPGKGGREGLPLGKWLRVVKWEALAAKQIAAERAAAGMPLASDWSWGWGDFPDLSPPDPDKPVTACVYLWARDQALCDGPARAGALGVGFVGSLTEGQIALRPGIQCAVGTPRTRIWNADVHRLAALRSDRAPGFVGRPAALTALFVRNVLRARARLSPARVTAVEDEVVAGAFAGSRAAYEAALAERGATVDVARGVLADQLLRRALQPVKRARLLASALATTTCLRDELPETRLVDLAASLPFLRLPPGRAGTSTALPR